MAAMIRIIATTISNSMREKPFCVRITVFLFVVKMALDASSVAGTRQVPELADFLGRGQ